MPNQENTSLKVAHYNIFNGGQNRLETIAKAIKEMGPDICGILEAGGWEKSPEIFQRYAKNLGYPFIAFAPANTRHTFAVISKFPIKAEMTRDKIHHVILHVHPESGPFKNTHIFFVHLSPTSEDHRLTETKILLNKIKSFEEVILMGDFNSLSSNDPYNKKSLLRKLQENSITKFGVEKLHFDVIEKIKKAGFIDAMEHLKQPFAYSVPTNINTDKDHSIPLRIDYAFLNQSAIQSLIGAELSINETTHTASDHYPLIIELRKQKEG